MLVALIAKLPVARGRSVILPFIFLELELKQRPLELRSLAPSSRDLFHLTWDSLREPRRVSDEMEHVNFDCAECLRPGLSSVEIGFRVDSAKKYMLPEARKKYTR